jgi:uncharacterized protein (DUF302 family)
MENEIGVIHVSMEINADFKGFTCTFELLLGNLDRSVFNETDPSMIERCLKEMGGEEDLMLFEVLDHGNLLNIIGSPKNAKQYVLGNPLIASEMTRHDIRAGLYAPLRVLVYETDDQLTRIDFDQPSSLFGQFNNPNVTTVAQSLDKKLINLIQEAESMAKYLNE